MGDYVRWTGLWTLHGSIHGLGFRKEVLFLRQVQEFMEPSMRVGAVNVFEDNEGAIKLATNKHASRRTKHIDVKHNLLRDASAARERLE